MQDGEIVALVYRCVTDDRFQIGDPDPVQWRTAEFVARLVQGQLRVELAVKIEREADARALVESYLEAWELAAGVSLGDPVFHFSFEHAERRGGGATLGRVTVSARGSGSVLYPLEQYPAPPTGFRVSATVDTLWHRYVGYRRGGEPLASMVNFCLTVVESEMGGRKAAACRYGFAYKVLSRLGYLVSEVGTLGEARKAGGKEPRGLTQLEREAVQKVVLTLIERAGRLAADPSCTFPQLTADHFPGLVS